MEFEIKYIRLWPTFKITFFISSIIFLMILLLLGNQFMAISNSFSSGMGGMEDLSGGLSFPMIFFASVTNALFFSMIITAGAALYNFFSRTFGGYVLFLDGDWEIETVEETEVSDTINQSTSDDSETNLPEDT